MVAVVVLVAACATQPAGAQMDAPGFLLGLVHGLIAPFSLVASLFRDVRIYAFPNSGILYDLGFLIGLTAWGGGTRVLSSGRKGPERNA
jgi:hypothetical protein